MVDSTRINYYMDIIAKNLNLNCTALPKLDKKKLSYRLCKTMADCLDDMTDIPMYHRYS
mgnify:CR=1 FL=1